MPERRATRAAGLLDVRPLDPVFQSGTSTPAYSSDFSPVFILRSQPFPCSSSRGPPASHQAMAAGPTPASGPGS